MSPARSSSDRPIWVLTTVMAALGLLMLSWLHGEPRVAGSALPQLDTWVEVVLTGVGFWAGERALVAIQVRRHGIAASLAEIPMALGILLVSPFSFVLGRALGTALGLLPTWRRASAVKLAYNVAMLTLGSAVTRVIFGALTRGLDDKVGVWGVLALMASVLIGYVWVNAMIALAIRLTDPQPQWAPLVRALGFSIGVTLALSLAGVYMAVAAYHVPSLLIFDAVASAGLYSLLRIYGTLGNEYVRLQKLYDFSKDLTGSSSVRAGAAATLEHGAMLLGASAGLLFVPWADEDHYWSFRDGAVSHLPIEPVTARAVAELLGQHDGAVSVALTKDARPGAHVLAEAGFGSVVMTGLRGHRGRGWLVFESSADGRNAKMHRTLVENVAGQSASALGRTELVDQLREENLQRQREALHDRLTTLPNRDYFSQRLAELVERRAPGEEIAVLIIDLDHFKEVNDSLGHHYGDLLLKEVGRRLSQSLRASEFLARLGGDEFGVLLHNKEATTAAASLAERIAKLLEQPVDIADTTISVGGSIGISFCPRHAEDPATLMQQADIAMYAAKRDDLTFVLYEAQSEKAWLRRLEVLGAMRATDLDATIRVHFQPQVDIATGRPVAMEALARWTDPKLGEVSPVEFIPVAEQSGLIRPLTMSVIEKSMAGVRTCLDAGYDLSVAVNLSGRALLDLEIVAFVADGLKRHRLDPSRILIEVTESVFVSDSQRLNEVLLAYEDLGIDLSIDDFGTGYSSLSYLRRLPARELKIDRTFVDGMVHDASKLAIVRSTVALAHELGLSAVAEGIEDVPTLALLRRIGCDVAQGYLLGRPMSLEDHLVWLQTPTIPHVEELDRVQSLLEAPVLRRPSLRRG